MTAKSSKHKILFVAAEVAPLFSTGGLADVVSALPRALHAQGHDVRIVLPCFRSIPDASRGEHQAIVKAELGAKTEHGALRKSVLPDTEIPLYLIEHQGYFDREHPYGYGAHEYPDNAERFCFFCLAALDGIAQTGWKPDLVHCHDWHAAPVAGYLKTRLARDAFWGGMPVLFSIHNLAFQGRYTADRLGTTGFGPELFTPEYLEFHGDMSLIKAAIAFSDKLSTVSPRYAKEIQTLEYGAGLDGVLRTRRADLKGILNGVDYRFWNPETDPHIPANYSARDLKPKAACKAALQKEFHLPNRPETPLFGLVSRLYWQKGIDLLVRALPQLLRRDMQLVVLGTGDPGIEAALSDAAKRYPDKIAVRLGFDVPLSHRIQAGSDFFLMPSRYEPCGLTQLYALAYGTIPIVRRTGGLADSVHGLDPYTRFTDIADGMSFVPLTHQALTRIVSEALELYGKPEALRTLQQRGMAKDFSWNRASQAYLALYAETIQAAKSSHAA